MKSSLFRSLTTSVMLAALVSGCAGSATQRSLHSLDAANTQGDGELAKSRYVAPDQPSGPYRERSGLYLAGATRENLHGYGLPVEWNKAKVTFVSQTPMSFREIADLITRQTKFSVVARDAEKLAVISAPAATTVRSSSADIAGPHVAAGPQPAGFDAKAAIEAAKAQDNRAAAEALSGPAMSAPTPGMMTVNYTGNLAGFLDLVADNFGFGWEYENGRISFSHNSIATFDIPALPIVMKLAFSLDSSAASTNATTGSNQSGGSSQKASTDAAFNLWSDLDTTMKSIVGSTGTINISGSTGTVTVNAPAVTIRQMRDYVTRINRELSREIVLAVDVYNVTLTQGDNYQLNLNVAFQKASQGGAALASAGAAGPGGVAPAALSTVLASATTGNNGIGYSILNPNSAFSGSNALLQALSTQGDVSVVTTANLTTLNGIPAPFQAINTRGYVASVSSTSTGAQTTGGAAAVQTTLTPGTVTSGFNLYVVPRVDKNGTVLLQYGVNISELVGSSNGFDVFTSGGQTVELPNINSRNFVQEASVPVGGTLVLTGFEQKNDTNNTSGVGSSLFPLFGGGTTAAHNREVVVIAISPRVVSFGAHSAIQ